MSRAPFVFGAIIALSLLASCQMPGSGNSRAMFSKNLDHTIDVAGVRSLSLMSGPGRLVVIGEEGRRAIAIVGVLRSEAESFEEAERIAGEVTLRGVSERTENPVVEVTEPRLARAGQGYTLDLTVRVPPGVLVSVEDSAGEIEVGGLAAGVRIRGSGRTTVEGVRGGVEVITDGLATAIEDSSGRIQVQDGRGELAIRGITGDVHVKDTDGKLEIRNISGNVDASDNPMGATVHNVEGDVTLVRISHGESDIQGIGGTISFPGEKKE